ncbi:MAG: PilT/PilU family type 4a pilus ATPase, partial [Armatimonadetes bacterium]|nr:PilT/PilU family type 4a pilus ATPase [Armatimonadota bacterium]
MIDWRQVITDAAALGASDVFWKPGSKPCMRLKSVIEKIEGCEVLLEKDTHEIAWSLMTEKQQAQFEEYHERDIGLTIEGICRLRINIYQERGNIGLVMRIIPLKIKTVQDLELPNVLNQIADERQGFVLVTGPTGCGKSTTLAAMIDHINANRQANIVTIEDPIEYVHGDKKSIVNMREIGLDTESFTDALKYVVRQSPDVILIGEMRDIETMNVAMQAAETGHLVFATVHTNSASETMDRVINMFPPHDQHIICLRLSKTLRAVLSQALVPRADGPGRVCALEIMRVTPTVAKCIEENRPGEVYPLIADGEFWGMQTKNQSLLKHYVAGRIAPQSALFYSGNYTEMRQMLRRANPNVDLTDKTAPLIATTETDDDKAEREQRR